MAASRLFVDTWGRLALANDRNPAFGSVSRIRAAVGLRDVWMTTDYVLEETMTRLFAAHGACASAITTNRGFPLPISPASS